MYLEIKWTWEREVASLSQQLTLKYPLLLSLQICSFLKSFPAFHLLFYNDDFFTFRVFGRANQKLRSPRLGPVQTLRGPGISKLTCQQIMNAVCLPQSRACGRQCLESEQRMLSKGREHMNWAVQAVPKKWLIIRVSIVEASVL